MGLVSANRWEIPVIDQLLRQPKERFLAPLALGPLRTVSPTTLTVAAFVVGLGAAVAAWQAAYPLALMLWLANRALDGLDGTVARLHGKQSDFGGYLDIVLDTVIYAAVPLGIALSVDTRSGYFCAGAPHHQLLHQWRGLALSVGAPGKTSPGRGGTR